MKGIQPFTAILLQISSATFLPNIIKSGEHLTWL